MTPSDSRLRVRRRTAPTTISRAAVLALGCALAGCARSVAASRSSERVVTPVPTPPTRAFPRRDGPEHELGIRWEESLDAAMERGRREKKPVLIAFSARRQEHDFEGEF
jgi:hypothetical protein